MNTDAYNDFLEYALSEYGIRYSSVKINYVHTVKPIPKNNTKDHIITMNIKLYDKFMNLLKSDNIKFVNNLVSKPCEKKLVNISPAELNNKFMNVRDEIIRIINTEYMTNRSNIDKMICDLDEYKGCNMNHIGVDNKFKGELVVIEDVSKNKNKRRFDM